MPWAHTGLICDTCISVHQQKIAFDCISAFGKIHLLKPCVDRMSSFSRKMKLPGIDEEADDDDDEP